MQTQRTALRGGGTRRAATAPGMWMDGAGALLGERPRVCVSAACAGRTGVCLSSQSRRADIAGNFACRPRLAERPAKIVTRVRAAPSAMSKKRQGRGDDGSRPRETGGLAESNAGIILADVVATRSWPVVLVAVLTFALFVRAAAGLGGYSGALPLPPAALIDLHCATTMGCD